MKKLLEYLKIALKATGKFLKYAYAAQLTILVFGGFRLVIGILAGSGWKVFWAVIVITWAGLLIWNEYIQNKDIIDKP